MRVAFRISRIAFEHAKRFCISGFYWRDPTTRDFKAGGVTWRLRVVGNWFFFGLSHFLIWHEVLESEKLEKTWSSREITIRPPCDRRSSCFRGNLFQSVHKWLPIKLQCQHRLFSCTITVKTPKTAIPPSLSLLIALICFLIMSQHNKVF